ncbi:MAG: AAA family ATPase [Sulfitobacter sp.]
MSETSVLITGCSGGGKSTLLLELEARGYATIPEPGRRIVAEEQAGTGKALPWVDMNAFARQALAMAKADLVEAQSEPDLVFFDRGLVDAAVALQFAGGEPYRRTIGNSLHYARTVFFAPPWPEIFSQDEERQHDFSSAVEEASRIEAALLDMGYDIRFLPLAPPKERADFVLAALERA